MKDSPTLADVIGPILGADFLFASGSVVETTPEHPDGLTHRFWGYRTMWRVERSDGVSFIDSPTESLTIVNGRRGERGPRHAPGLHLPERMLRPRYADIWGRSGDDWRLTGEVRPSETDAGEVVLGIARVDDMTEQGTVVVDRARGRIRRLARPGALWELVDLTEESDGDATGLFAI